MACKLLLFETCLQCLQLILALLDVLHELALVEPACIEFILLLPEGCYLRIKSSEVMVLLVLAKGLPLYLLTADLAREIIKLHRH